jgi:hypothetical protein
MAETQSNPVQTGKKPYVAIFIYPETRRKLAVAKALYGFKSYDELIMHLLKQAGYADQ